MIQDFTNSKPNQNKQTVRSLLMLDIKIPTHSPRTEFLFYENKSNYDIR